MADQISGHPVQTLNQLQSWLYSFKIPALSCFVGSFEQIYWCMWWHLEIECGNRKYKFYDHISRDCVLLKIGVFLKQQSVLHSINLFALFTHHFHSRC